MAKCVGCGCKLQSTDENNVGYVPLNILNDSLSDVYCKRCYQIMHNGLKYKPIISHESYYKKMSKLKDENCLVVLMLDVLDPYGSFIDKLDECIGSNKVILCVNKIDLLPKSFKINLYEERLKKFALKSNLNVIKIVYISSLKNNVDTLINSINKVKVEYSKKNYGKQLDNTYIVGQASVGKSTFINALLKKYNKTIKLTTSLQFQTTLDFVKIPLGLHDFIIDTPGLVNNKSVLSYLSYKSIEKLTPIKYLKPITYQLNSKSLQTIFLGGLARIDFISENLIGASFFTSSSLHLHRTKTIQADTVYQNNIHGLLNPPLEEDEYDLLSNQKVSIYKINKSCDLFISGIGFVHIVGLDIEIKVYTKKEICVWIEYDE